MAALHCWIFGHDWVPAIRVGKPDENIVMCDRCEDTKNTDKKE